jgi:hypothetical protein
MFKLKKNKIMKKLLVLLFVFFQSCMMYHEISYTENEKFIKIYELQQSKEQLFIKANDWFVSYFVSAYHVIDYSDKQSGVIIGKYLMFGDLIHTQYGTIDSRIYAKIDVRVKDEKIMLNITPVGVWRTSFVYTKEMATSQMNELADSFYSHLQTAEIDF